MKRHGFTVTELLVSIVALALLGVLALVLGGAARLRADGMVIVTPALAAGDAGFGGGGFVDDASPADVVKWSGASSTTASSATSDALNVNSGGDRPSYCQVEISAAATAVWKGRVSSSLSYVTMYTFTSSGMAQIPRVTQNTVVVTGNTGTVSAAMSPFGR